MKLSKNNKHFLSVTLKDKTSNNTYSESKAASICCYNAEIISHLSEKDLTSLNLNLETIENFSDLKFLFENEEHQKKLLSKTIIRSENPFIISMQDINKTSKIKYFIELICLNKIELIPEFNFFSDFFNKLHRTNFLYLYHTNKLEEFAEIKFILQVESFYQKTFLISKDANYVSINNSNNDFIMSETDKNQFACEKKISMNNTTIKEVTEDEKIMGNESASRIHKSKNHESICNMGISEHSNINNKSNKNYYQSKKDDENNLYSKEKNQNNQFEYFKTFSFKNKIELKKTFNFEINNSGSGLDRIKPLNTEENLKYNNSILVDLKAKNPMENQNISTIKDQIRLSSDRKQEDIATDENQIKNSDQMTKNFLEEVENSNENNKYNNKTNPNELIDKSLKYDNNIDFNLDEKDEQVDAFDNEQGMNNEYDRLNHKGKTIPEPEKESGTEESNFAKSSKKSLNSKNQVEKKESKNLSQRSKNVFLTGNEIENQNNLNSLENDIKKENDVNNVNNIDKSIKDMTNESRKFTENINKNLDNDNQKDNLNINIDENACSNFVKNKDFYNKSKKDSLTLNQKELENDKDLNFNYVFSNNDNRSENKEIERFTNNNFYNSNNNFFSTNPHGSFYSTSKKSEFIKDQIFEINFNIGNYNFIYIDLDYSLRNNLKSNLEKLCKFVQWAWENFRYIKFILYLPKVQNFFLDLNQKFVKEITEIFSIADILLFEKKDLISYKNILQEVSDIKNKTASQFFNFNNTATTFNSNLKNLNNNTQKFNKSNNNTLEEFFLNEFKIKKRLVPLVVYPTKTLVILDELSNIIIYEKNYENKLIFKADNDFILYPQINHTNQNIIELYKSCLKENYCELRGIFIGGFLSKIMQKPVKVDTITSKDYTSAYMISIELAKKFLKLFFHQKPYPVTEEFYLIKLDKIIANTKLAEDIHRRRESKFVLDCVNKKKSFLKFYEPLNDNNLKDFFSLRSVSNTMRNFGFEKNQGKFIEPEKNNKLKKNDSLKIGGKFFISNPLKNISNIKNSAFEYSSMINNNSNINMLDIGSESANNVYFSNYNNFHLISNLNSVNNLEVTNRQRGNSLLTRSKVKNINTNLNSIGNGSGINSKSFMQKPNKVKGVFGKNITINLPRLVTPQIKIDPEEQIRNYVEFEKNLIID